MPYITLYTTSGETIALPDATERGTNIYQWKALHSNVLVVASANRIPGRYTPKKGDWSAYIRNVPGMNHEMEWSNVASTGSKIPLYMAEKLFPTIAENFQWRG